MPPEVYGEISRACKWAAKTIPYNANGFRKKKIARKKAEKVQKHLARALRYQANRGL